MMGYFTTGNRAKRNHEAKGLAATTVSVSLYIAALIAPAALFAPTAMVQSALAQAGSPTADATPGSLFVDFLHYSVLGRFEVADGYARQLLNHPDLDPVEIHRLSLENDRSVETLLVLIRNSSIADSAGRVMDLIREGEHLLRKDGDRIRANIEKLVGSPQEEHFAIIALTDSGEYAIPPMVQALDDDRRQALWPRIIRALPKIGLPAVRPLAESLQHENARVVQIVAGALGDLGYAHAIPYLQSVVEAPESSAESRSAAMAAIARIELSSGRTSNASSAAGFVALGGYYFDETGAVRADDRLAEANIWYWDKATQLLQFVSVPTQIFGAVMGMRCSERALSLESDRPDAIGLWLASNIRREARLGMNVESDDAGETAMADPSRPADFPRALYFTRAAGARYAQMSLRRALDSGDTQLALGAIAALRSIAGPATLMSHDSPLVGALRYPDTMVRIRAAVALAHALPGVHFEGSHLVTPILGRAAALTASRNIVVIDNDQNRLNATINELRDGQSTVIGEANAMNALERARAELPRISGIFIAADVMNPSLKDVVAAIRRVVDTSRVPIVVMLGADDRLAAERVAGNDDAIEIVDTGSPGDILLQHLDDVNRRIGQSTISEDVAHALAI